MDSLNEPGPHDPTGPGADPSGAGRSPAPASPAPAGPAFAGPASAGSGSDGASGPGAQPGVGRNPGEGARDVVPDDLEDEGVPGELVPAGVLAGRVAEKLAPGPDLAAWLSLIPAAELGDADLAATAGAWRRLASWAQAKELAAVAQIASRSAARDEDIGTGPAGRPARIPASAAAEVALELTMSRYGASWWAGLAVDLGWRLPGTGAALESGVIDLYRARLICEATTRLSDEAARSVESKVLPAAGGQTPGMLRAALRRAVIAADPEGADRRREESERQAKVVLYPDEEHTATLARTRPAAAGAAFPMMARRVVGETAARAAAARQMTVPVAARLVMTCPAPAARRAAARERAAPRTATRRTMTRRVATCRVMTCRRPGIRTRPVIRKITRGPATARPRTMARPGASGMARARTMTTIAGRLVGRPRCGRGCRR